MTERATSAQAMLGTWREQQADRLDPVRFGFIEAMARRAASCEGEARRVLDARLDELLAAYGQQLAQASTIKAAKQDSERAATNGLAELVASHAATRGGKLGVLSSQEQPAFYPELPLLDAFRRIWSQVRTESQLRQSMEEAPENAGPLNSAALVHRSIGLMRELSPGYLQQFLAYIDDLSWLEQWNAWAPSSMASAAQPTTIRKRTRKKSPAGASDADA